jgi:uncharacterized membrane protein YdjX (TVP38/TMEM64 family)
MKLQRRFRLEWVLIICLLGGFISYLIYQFNSSLWIQAVRIYNFLHDPHQLKAFVHSFGPYAPLAYILVQALQVIIAPIPGGAIEFLSGYLFGVKAGFIYSMVGSILGSWLAFSLAKIFEKIVVEKFVSPESMRKFDYLIEHQGVILSFLLFLIPGFPKDALCYILGLTPMQLSTFLIISTVGRVPGTLMAIFQGAKASDGHLKILLILLGVSALVILICWIHHEKIHRFLKRETDS